LNFAATLAQSARLWKDYDPTFAADCLEKAEIAWQAALKHPDIYAEYTPVAVVPEADHTMTTMSETNSTGQPANFM